MWLVSQLSMSAEFRKEVGVNLKEARRKAGLKQAEVPTVAGIAYRHYQDIETGKVNVTLDTLCRLAQAYKTSVAKLVRGRC